VLNLSEYAAKPRLLADYLPWACLVAPGVVINKDGAFQTSFRYRGPDLESSTEAELVSVTARVNNVLRRFGSGWALFFEAVRRDADPYSPGIFTNAAAWLIDQERLAANEAAQSRFESEYYLTLTWLPPQDTTGRAEQALIERPSKAEDAAWRERLDQFEVRTAQAFDLLSGCLSEITPLSDDETLTYLHACISTSRHKVVTPSLPVFLDAILPDAPLSGGLEPMIGDKHLRVLTVLGFPGTTLPGLLDELNRQGFAYRWTTRFIALGKAEAEKLLSRKRRHWFAKRKSIGAVLRETLFNEESALLDNDASNKAADADAALQELGSDLVSYGYITTSLVMMSDGVKTVDDQVRAAERVLHGRGLTTIRESLNAVEAWLGSLPGHVYANVRQPIISSLNLAHLAPLSAVWAGEPGSEHLRGAAMLEARTDGTTPFRVNLHVGDVGHTLIVGPTGSGKSVLLSLIALQFCRYEAAQIFVFERGRSSRATMLSMGASYFGPGHYDHAALQPLRDIDEDAGATFASDWLEGICTAEGVAMTPDLKSALWAGIRSLASAPPKKRTLTGLCMLLQSDTLRAALRPFTLEGPYGRLLDGDHEDLLLTDTACFELEDLMQIPDAVAPVLSYLFHRLEETLDGRPTLILLDEAWVFLDHPLFSARLRAWLKTLRKKNAAVVFATQSLADVEASSISATLIESCPTRIFLPNDRALEPQQASTYRRFGLNERQIEIISSARPKRDYYFTSPLGCRLFDLDLGPLALSLCAAASPEDQRLIDQCATAANTGTFAGDFLKARGFGWAADLLSAWPGHKNRPRDRQPCPGEEREAP